MPYKCSMMLQKHLGNMRVTILRLQIPFLHTYTSPLLFGSVHVSCVPKKTDVPWFGMHHYPCVPICCLPFSGGGVICLSSNRKAMMWLLRTCTKY